MFSALFSTPPAPPLPADALLSQRRTDLSRMIQDIRQTRTPLMTEEHRQRHTFSSSNTQLDRLYDTRTNILSRNSHGKRSSSGENEIREEGNLISCYGVNSLKLDQDIEALEDRRQDAEARLEVFVKEIDRLNKQQGHLQGCLNQLQSV